MAEERVQRRLAAILAADVVGYSRLMRDDEEGTLAVLTAHRAALIEPCIAEHRGRVVKTTGDGLLAEFASVVDAVRCAIAFQDGMAARNADTPGDRRITFRIGVNLGDVIVQDDDVFGDGVNVAARLEGLAEPGSIWVSGSVHEQVVHRIDAGFDDLGPQRVKNIADPVRVFRIRRNDVAAVAAAGPAPAGAPPPLPDKPSIAVLPFDNMSADPEQAYFSDGISEDIITDLSKISGLFVIARNSSFQYRGKSVDVRDVARDLGVGHVLEGSIRRAGGRIRITAQLVDAANGNHIWAERYDRELQDVFAVQDEIAAKVVAELAVTLQAHEQERLYRRHTNNLEAYDTYLRAWRLRNPTRDADRLAERRKLLERVIELDPDFAGGYALLSFNLTQELRQDLSASPEEDIERALALAQKAVATDDTFGVSYAALGSAYLMNHEHDKAVDAAREAIRVQPSDADGYLVLGFYLHWAGQGEDAIDAVKTAMRLDPMPTKSASHRHASYLGMAYFTAGRYADAIAAFIENAELRVRRGTNSTCILAAAYIATGQEEKARAAVKGFLEENPGYTLSNYKHPRIYKRKEDLERYLDLLRKAGMPE
jgi:adenylate cyclase